MIKRTKEQRINLMKGLVQNSATYRGMNLTQLAKALSERFDRKPSLANFSSRLNRGTLTVLELCEIMDYLNYSIDFSDLLTDTKFDK